MATDRHLLPLRLAAIDAMGRDTRRSRWGPTFDDASHGVGGDGGGVGSSAGTTVVVVTVVVVTVVTVVIPFVGRMCGANALVVVPWQRPPMGAPITTGAGGGIAGITFAAELVPLQRHTRPTHLLEAFAMAFSAARERPTLQL